MPKPSRVYNRDNVSTNQSKVNKRSSIGTPSSQVITPSTPSDKSQKQDEMNSSVCTDFEGRITERVRLIEKNQNVHAYLFRGLVPINNEDDGECLKRFMEDVLKLTVNESTISSLQIFGKDYKTRTPVYRVGFPFMVSERLKKLVVGGSCLLVEYNKNNGTSYFVEKCLSQEEQHIKREGLLAQKALRKMLGKETWVALSPNNYKLRVGAKGGRWTSVDELKMQYPELGSAMEEMSKQKSAPAKRKMVNASSEDNEPASKVSKN